jgi:ankyrin repeat protein
VRVLAAGADPNAVSTVHNSDGESRPLSPLFAAAQNDHLEAARLLLDGGADPSLGDGDGSTPLTTTALRGHVEVLRLLLARGAAMDTQTASGNTAFHLACAANQPKCAEALARAGFDIGIKNNEGRRTGQEIVERSCYKDVVRRLRNLVGQPFVGVVVELAGLVGAAEHNGKRATVQLCHLCFTRAFLCSLC